MLQGRGELDKLGTLLDKQSIHYDQRHFDTSYMLQLPLVPVQHAHSIAGDDICRCFSSLSTIASGAVSDLRRKTSPKLEAVSLYRRTEYHRDEKRCSLVSLSIFLASSSDTWRLFLNSTMV